MLLLRTIWKFLAGTVTAACFLVPVVSAQITTEPIPLPEGIEATGDTTEVRALSAWALEHGQRSPQDAERVAQRALTLAQELDDLRGIGVNLTTLGLLTSNFGQKEIYYREAREAFMQLGDDQAIARSNINLGFVYADRGDFRAALTYYFDALDGFQRISNKAAEATVLLNIGTIYLTQDNPDEALSYLERAAMLVELLDEQSVLAISIYGNLGNALVAAGMYERAEVTLRRALAIAEEQQNRYFIVMGSNNLGALFNKQGLHSSALPFLLTADRLGQELGHKHLLVAVWDELGKAYMGLGEYDRALYYAQESLVVAQEMNSMPRQMNAHETLSRIYEAMGNHEQALLHYRHFAVARDSVFTTERAEIITEMQARYETQEAHRAIERLEQQNQIQQLQSSRRQAFLFAGLGGLLLILGVLYYRYRLKQRANRLLEELDAAKSRFFANISHEFRTPLTVILGGSQDILSGYFGRVPERVASQLQAMLRNTRQLQGLIDEVLDLNRLESGRLELRLLPGDVVRFLQRLVETHAPLAERKGVGLTFESSVESCPRLYDAEKLEKIVGNLLSNALKFTPRDGSVHVNLHCGAMAEITVADSGPGIPAEALDTIFERFIQLDEGARHGGTGIGLALAKELVELHGGTITVESTPYNGSTFTVRLPLKEIALSEVQEAQAELISLPELKVGGDGYAVSDALPSVNGPGNEDDRTTILLIEDNDDVRAYVRRSLEARYRILEALDGESGLQQARTELPDLIVSDVMLPGMTGYEVARRLKAETATECIPVVMLTARAADKDQTEGYGSGAEVYLTKPFSPESLQAATARLLEERRRLQRRLQHGSKPDDQKPANGLTTLSDRARTIILEHLHDETFSVEELASALGMSRYALHHRLKQEMGLAPSDFIRTFRLERGRELLAGGAGSVSEVAYAVGFNSLVAFSRAYRAHYGAPPSMHYNRAQD